MSDVTTEQPAAVETQENVTENLYAQPAESEQSQTQESAPQQPNENTDLQESVDIATQPNKLYEEPVVGEKNVLNNVDYNFDNLETTTEITDHDRNLVRSIGKSLGLTNEQARKLLAEGGGFIAKEQEQMRKEILAKWSNEILNDSEIGGVNFTKTRSNLYRVMKDYGSQEVLDILNKTGLGSHPALVRMFNKIGNALSEDNKFVQGQPVVKKTNPLDLIYDNSPNLS